MSCGRVRVRGPVPALVTARSRSRVVPDRVAPPPSPPIDDFRGSASTAVMRFVACPRASRCARLEDLAPGQRRGARNRGLAGGEPALCAPERLGLPGSKNACGSGVLACTVLLGGPLVCACLVLAAQADCTRVTGGGWPEKGSCTACRMRSSRGCGPLRVARRAHRCDPRSACAQPLSERYEIARVLGNPARTGYAKIFDAVSWRPQAVTQRDEGHKSTLPGHGRGPRAGSGRRWRGTLPPQGGALPG